QRHGEDLYCVVVMVALRDLPVTDDDLTLLKQLPFVENLDLTNTQITGAGLAHLKHLKNLQYLGLWKTQIDDAGLAHLKDLTQLWALVLDKTPVGDAGLVPRRGLTTLEEWLGLAFTRVPARGLRPLGEMGRLRTINLRGTAVTVEGARELRKALPHTHIS